MKHKIHVLILLAKMSNNEKKNKNARKVPFFHLTISCTTFKGSGSRQYQARVQKKDNNE